MYWLYGDLQVDFKIWIISSHEKEFANKLLSNSSISISSTKYTSTNEEHKVASSIKLSTLRSDSSWSLWSQCPNYLRDNYITPCACIIPWTFRWIILMESVTLATQDNTLIISVCQICFKVSSDFTTREERNAAFEYCPVSLDFRKKSHLSFSAHFDK